MTLLVILYTLWFGRGALLILCIFVTLEGTVYGFHLWWIAYLYVWVVLWLAVTAWRAAGEKPLLWAGAGRNLWPELRLPLLVSLSGSRGNSHDARLVAAGIPFDLIHGFANFALILVLFSPLDSLWKRANSSKTK